MPMAIETYFIEEDINGEETELDRPFVGQLGFQDFLVDTCSTKMQVSIPPNSSMILAVR